jgi:hypothetical protein
MVGEDSSLSYYLRTTAIVLQYYVVFAKTAVPVCRQRDRSHCALPTTATTRSRDRQETIRNGWSTHPTRFTKPTTNHSATPLSIYTMDWCLHPSFTYNPSHCVPSPPRSIAKYPRRGSFADDYRSVSPVGRPEYPDFGAAGQYGYACQNTRCP